MNSEHRHFIFEVWSPRALTACMGILTEELVENHHKYSSNSSHTVPATGNVKMKRVQTRLVAKLKRVCVHHAQVMLGTVERSKHDFY